jgi:hypothetical protein
MEDWEVWPDFAYVPGKTQRHPEGAFDAIRDTAQAGFSPEQLAECHAFRLGLRYLERGYYWEAHEVFEPVWMVLPDPSIERQFVQGLIQVANGYLKLEMDRPKAAVRLVVIAQSLIPAEDAGVIMTVELAGTYRMLASLDAQAKEAL